MLRHVVKKGSPPMGDSRVLPCGRLYSSLEDASRLTFLWLNYTLYRPLWTNFILIFCCFKSDILIPRSLHLLTF